MNDFRIAAPPAEYMQGRLSVIAAQAGIHRPRLIPSGGDLVSGTRLLRPHRLGHARCLCVRRGYPHGFSPLAACPRRLPLEAMPHGFPPRPATRLLPPPRQAEQPSPPHRQNPRAAPLSCRLPRLPLQGGVIQGPGAGFHGNAKWNIPPKKSLNRHRPIQHGACQWACR